MWDGATGNKILYYVIEHKPIDAAVDSFALYLYASSRIYRIKSSASQLYNDTYRVFEYLLIKRDCLPHTKCLSDILTSTAAGEVEVID